MLSNQELGGWQLCVAPMIDWTDRHCRYFHRLLAPRARLYTEMIATGAILYGDAARHLDFSPQEHPVALQLGGNEPGALARAARAGQDRGYDEINLNCGCPSDRVQKGAFGACLMSTPALVADCVKAMRDAVQIPVTVKHRIGLDYDESYAFVRDFVGTVHEAGCDVFIVHARNAVLKGLSPKENREIPPLRYDVARQLKRDFPGALIVLNGGLAEADATLAHIAAGGGELDGVMLGREAYHRPRVLSELSQRLWPAAAIADDAEVIQAMTGYARAQVARGVPLRAVARHMLGLFNAQGGARRWRQTLSDSRLLAANDPGLIETAWAMVEPGSQRHAA
nr:tRNA dihydrouridine(20/20a) synthase DusA [Pigmentiphaga humi]